MEKISETKAIEKLVKVSLTASVVAITLIIGVFATEKTRTIDFNPSSPIYYNTSGRITPPAGSRVAIWDDYVVPTTANANMVDYSSAHFITAPIVTITPEQSASGITAVSVLNISGRTATNCTVSLFTSSQQSLNTLGTVFTGLVSATNISGIKLHVRAKGYTLDK